MAVRLLARFVTTMDSLTYALPRESQETLPTCMSVDDYSTSFSNTIHTINNLDIGDHIYD